MKKILVLLILMILTACGGGGSNSDNNALNDETTPSEDTNYTSNWSFPYIDNIEFQRQDTGDVIALSDKSLWYITGTSNSSYDVLGSHDITIYESTDSFSEPTTGIRSPYYMYIEGSSRSFYVEPIYELSIIDTDTIEFYREKTGSLVALTDGTLWNIKGTHSSGYDVLYSHNITVYSNTNSIPALNTSGLQTNYYMYISGSSRGFYIEPITNVKVLLKDTLSFNRQKTGDTIALSDGSLWYIKGTHSFGYDVLDNHAVTIYSDVSFISNPTFGERSDYYMYISGSSRGFFIEPL